MATVSLQRAGYQAEITRVNGLVTVALLKPGDRNRQGQGSVWHDVVRWWNVDTTRNLATLHALFDPMCPFTDVDLTAIKAVVV